MPRPSYTIKVAKAFDAAAKEQDFEARYRAKHNALSDVLDPSEMDAYGVAQAFSECDLALLDKAFAEVKAEYEAPMAEAQGSEIDRIAAQLDRIPTDKIKALDALLGKPRARQGFRAL